MQDENPDPGRLRLPDGRVLVHIGPHKTGTTSLQAALVRARPEMREQGVHHAGWARNPARAVQAVTGQTSTYDDRPPPISEWQALAREIRRTPTGRVILSSEFLAHAGPASVRRVVGDLGRDRVHVVATLRPLARLIPSMWQQNVKAGRRITWDAWLHRLFPGPGEQAANGFWMLHRHDRLLERWAAEIGADRVTAVVVDESDRASLLRTFEALLGLSDGTLQPVEGLANRALTAEEAETIRAFNIAAHRANLDKATLAMAMRYGAAQYVAGLPPPAKGTPIRLPAWALEPVGETAHGIVDGIRASGVQVIGDLDALLWQPDKAPESGRLPTKVTAAIAARVAMGIVVAGGRTRSDDAVPESQLQELISAVPTRQLAASVAIRIGAGLGRRGRRGIARVKVSRPRIDSGHRAPVVDRRPPADAILPAGSIVLHIGPPKTGTTSIQAAFWAAREDVEAQGVHYAGSRRHSMTAVHAALGRRGIRNEDVPPISIWHRLRDEILQSTASRVLLSSEFFADGAPERIRDVVDELGRDRVQVVVTLRPLAKIIPSQWQQYVQSGLRTGYGPWLDAMLNRPERRVTPSFWHRHHDDQLIARWAEVVGADRVTAVVVDEGDRDAILRSFEALLGLGTGTLQQQEELANRSLTMQEIEAVRALNREFHAAGLGRPEHAELVNFGATEYLKTLPQKRRTNRPELPAWTVPRVEEIAAEIVAGIRSSGIRVIGDLDQLAVVRGGVGPGPRGQPVPVPVSIAARLAMGVLYASGMAPSTPAGTGQATPRWSLRIVRRPVEPVEIARVPTRRLVREVGQRGRSTLTPRRRR